MSIKEAMENRMRFLKIEEELEDIRARLTHMVTMYNNQLKKAERNVKYPKSPKDE